MKTSVGNIWQKCSWRNYLQNKPYGTNRCIIEIGQRL